MLPHRRQAKHAITIFAVGKLRYRKSCAKFHKESVVERGTECSFSAAQSGALITRPFFLPAKLGGKSPVNSPNLPGVRWLLRWGHGLRLSRLISQRSSNSCKVVTSFGLHCPKLVGNWHPRGERHGMLLANQRCLGSAGSCHKTSPPFWENQALSLGSDPTGRAGGCSFPTAPPPVWSSACRVVLC